MRCPFATSLRTSILVALLMVGLLPILVMLSASHLLLRRVFERSGKETIEVVVERVAHEIAHYAEHAQRDVRQMLQRITGWDLGASPERYAEEMNRLRESSSLITDLALYDADGELLLSTSEACRESVRYTEWFERALAGEFVVTAPMRLPGLTDLYICMYVRVGDVTNKLARVLVARTPFARIEETLRGIRVGRAGWMMLLDSRGNALYHPDPSQILRRPLGDRTAQWWHAHPQGLLRVEGDAPMLYAASVISSQFTGSGEPWFAIALRPYAEVLTPLQEYRRVLALAALMMLLAVIVVGVFVSTGLSRPLLASIRAVQQVSAGDLSARLPEKGAKELCDLARTFNQMIQEIRQYREHVESIVQHRTASLRESQARLEERATYLRAALESLVDGVLMVQWPDGRVLAANHPFAVLFGLEDREPLTGRRLSEIEEWITPRMADQRTDRFGWESLKDRPESISLEEWEVAAPVKRVLNVSSTPAVGPQGAVLARLYMFRDLTEQRQLQEELRQAQKMEAVGRLAGGIAHDFNNLLTGILGNLSMAEMEPAGSPQRDELIHSARVAAQRASDLVRQLLGFSRRSRLRLHVLSVNDVVKDVCALLQHSTDPRIELKTDLEPSLWRVRGDATQIQQVLMNLCVNAIDAMPEGGLLKLTTANVRVTAEQAREWMDGRPGDFVRISVSDQGHGMSQEVKSHLFEPFFTTKEPGKGTGLGLAMSYGIVRQHEGWITCYSELNRGTTFHIFLPGLRGAEVEKVEQPAEVSLRGGSERVLVVDDEPAVRAVVTAILQRYGYSVVQAAHGEEALHVLAQSPEKPDVVVLDLTMPKLSGPETLRRIRQLYPALPVIVSSGYPIDLESFSRETGVRPDGIVQKPYEVQVFAKTLRDVLDFAKAKPPVSQPDVGPPSHI